MKKTFVIGFFSLSTLFATQAGIFHCTNSGLMATGPETVNIPQTWMGITDFWNYSSRCANSYDVPTTLVDGSDNIYDILGQHTVETGTTRRTFGWFGQL